MSAPQKTITIAHIETGRYLYGGAQQVAWLLEGLNSRGVNNLLIAPKGSHISEHVKAAGTATVLRTSTAGDLSPRFYRETKQLLTEYQPSLVHIHSRRGADTLGGLAARRVGIPAVLSRRVDNREHPLAIRFKYPLYREVIGISQAICDVLAGQGVDREHLHCVHSTVDSGAFDISTENRSRARKALANSFAIPEDHLLLAVVAQLIPRKGHKQLLEVLPQIIEQYPAFKLLIFGQGPERDAIAAQIKTHHLSQHVVLAGFHAELDKDLMGLDLIVHPAEKEGLGVALLKASAAGVPVIAGRAGGIPEIIRDHHNGLLFEPGDNAQLQRCLEQLLASPSLRTQMGAAGIEIAQNEFSIDTMVDGNLAVYHRILSTNDIRIDKRIDNDNITNNSHR